MKKLTTLSIGLSLVASTLLATPNIELNPVIEEIVSGKRIVINATIEDDVGFDVARTYFKSVDGANYSFVPMNCEETACSATLPATSQATKSIDYLVLVKNKENVVYKTQTFSAVTLEEGSSTPSYQMDPTDEAIQVKTELTKAPEMVEGFSDNVAMDTVDSTLRFGAVAGITSVGSSAATGGAAAATSATGATAGGTVAATSAATISTAAIVGGTVAVVAGGAAVAVNNAADDSSSNDGHEEVVTQPEPTPEPVVTQPEPTPEPVVTPEPDTSASLVSNQVLVIYYNIASTYANQLSSAVASFPNYYIENINTSTSCSSLGYTASGAPQTTYVEGYGEVTVAGYTTTDGKVCAEADYGALGELSGSSSVAWSYNYN